MTANYFGIAERIGLGVIAKWNRLGASVFDSVKLNSGDRVRIFGERDITLALRRLPKKVRVRVRR